MTEFFYSETEWVPTLEAARLCGVGKYAFQGYRRRGLITAHNPKTGEPFAADFSVEAYRPIYRREDVLKLYADLNPWRLIPLERDSWVSKARCRSLGVVEGTRIFFPGNGVGYDEARGYCQACPVRLECLQWAVKVGCEDGMFGGAAPVQLRKFAKAWTKRGELPQHCAWCGEAYLGTLPHCSVVCREADEAGEPICPAAPEAPRHEPDGVSYDKRQDRWRARIGGRDSRRYLGDFETEEAALAAVAAARAEALV